MLTMFEYSLDERVQFLLTDTNPYIRLTSLYCGKHLIKVILQNSRLYSFYCYLELNSNIRFDNKNELTYYFKNSKNRFLFTSLYKLGLNSCQCCRTKVKLNLNMAVISRRYLDYSGNWCSLWTRRSSCVLGSGLV